MRSDYALYMVAVIFFAITAISYAALEKFELERNLSVVATVIIGFFFAGLGYTQRQKTVTRTIELPPPPPMPTVTKTVEYEENKSTEEPARPRVELTAVKGIKDKRAEQLRTLGISNVEELAKASANDLAAKLKISPKFTEKWIENARELIAKS